MSLRFLQCFGWTANSSRQHESLAQTCSLGQENNTVSQGVSNLLLASAHPSVIITPLGIFPPETAKVTNASHNPSKSTTTDASKLQTATVSHTGQQEHTSTVNSTRRSLDACTTSDLVTSTLTTTTRSSPNSPIRPSVPLHSPRNTRLSRFNNSGTTATPSSFHPKSPNHLTDTLVPDTRILSSARVLNELVVPDQTTTAHVNIKRANKQLSAFHVRRKSTGEAPDQPAPPAPPPRASGAPPTIPSPHPYTRMRLSVSQSNLATGQPEGQEPYDCPIESLDSELASLDSPLAHRSYISTRCLSLPRHGDDTHSTAHAGSSWAGQLMLDDKRFSQSIRDRDKSPFTMLRQQLLGQAQPHDREPRISAAALAGSKAVWAEMQPCSPCSGMSTFTSTWNSSCDGSSQPPEDPAQHMSRGSGGQLPPGHHLRAMPSNNASAAAWIHKLTQDDASSSAESLAPGTPSESDDRGSMRLSQQIAVTSWLGSLDEMFMDGPQDAPVRPQAARYQSSAATSLVRTFTGMRTVSRAASSDFGNFTDPSTGVVGPETVAQVTPLILPLDLDSVSTQIQLLRMMAKGAHGVVYTGAWMGQDVAVKVMMADQSETRAGAALTECLLCTQLSHPNVVRTYACQASTVTHASLQLVDQLTYKFCCPDPTPKPQPAVLRSWKAIPRLLNASEPAEGGAVAPAAAELPNTGLDCPVEQGVTATERLAQVLMELGARTGQLLLQIVMEQSDLGSLQHALAKGWFTITNPVECNGSNMQSAAAKLLSTEEHLQDPVVRMSQMESSLQQQGLELQGLGSRLHTACGIAKGMAYLHDNGIIHADLKPGNILLCSSPTDPRGFTAKIADFGLSRILGNNKSLHDCDVKGTVAYLAPEVFDGRWIKASDVYAFGVMLWQMLAGKRPYIGLQHMQILVAVSTGEHLTLLPWPVGIPPALQQLGTECLARSPDQRPTFHQVLERLLQLQKEVE